MNIQDIYPPGRIPHTEYAQGPVDNNFEDLVAQVVRQHTRKGRKVSNQDVKKQLYMKGMDMGLNQAQAAGLFGDIWHGVKQAGSKLVGDAWEKFKDDPVSSIKSIADTLGSLIEAGKTVGEAAAV